MRRATFVLGLTSSAVALALVALVYSIGSHRSPSSTVEPRRGEAKQAQQTSSIDAEVHDSTAVVEPPRASDGYQKPTVTEALSDTGFVDEDTRKMVREGATHNVQKLYSLLFEHLDLTPSEKDALRSLLIEDRIASTSTEYSRGKHIDEQDQSNRIAAIIGDPKLQQFRALERNLGSYGEVQYVEAVLQRNAIPITEVQRDRMLGILIDVQNQELTLPGADAERGSIEYLEYRLAEMDERDRLVLEQAASVLSAEQVRYMFERNQRLSYQRADALEAQQKARADESTEDLPLWYPGRTD